MTNLNLYRFFCCVAEEKNISKASEKLFVSQPAVSFAIRELETELKQQLFIRKSKGVELTSFGKLLYEQVKNSIDKFDNIENFAKRYKMLEQGIIRIGSCTSNTNQIVLNYIAEFAKQYPNISIAMERGDKEQLLQKLKNNDLDMIFIDNTEKADEFVTVKKFNVTYQLIGNKAYKTKFKEENIDVKNFPVSDLMLPTVNNSSRLAINKFFNENNITLAPKYELDNYILLYEFVKKGFGMAFVNIDYYKQAVENKEVFVIYPEFSICAREIVCLIDVEQTNPAVKKLIKIIEANKV